MAKRVMPTNFPTEFDIPLKLFPFSAELAWCWGISGASAVLAGDFLQGPKKFTFCDLQTKNSTLFSKITYIHENAPF